MKNEKGFYSELQLVKFGEYLLSEKRKQSILSNPNHEELDERMQKVYDADISNSGVVETDFNLAE